MFKYKDRQIIFLIDGKLIRGSNLSMSTRYDIHPQYHPEYKDGGFGYELGAKRIKLTYQDRQGTLITICKYPAFDNVKERPSGRILSTIEGVTVEDMR